MGSAHGSTTRRRGSLRLPGVVVLAALALAGGAVGAAAQTGDDTAAPDASMASDSSGNVTGSLDGSSLDAIIAEVLGGPDVPDSLQAYWASTFPTFSDKPYHDPKGDFLPYHADEASGGACGEAPGEAADNAAYCGGDESITYDIDWFARLLQDSGTAAPVTVLAHEWGHHIQSLAGSPDISKSAELQADCYGGMYLRSLADAGVLGDRDVTDSLAVTYSIGDAPADQGAWTDPDVHGAPNERRQAEGIGYSTASGDYCVAYGDWQDEPAAPLFGDKSIRLEPFADPTRTTDDSFSFELPGATVQLFQLAEPGDGTAATNLPSDIDSYLPEAAGWDIATPEDGWLEDLGWGTGSGATTTFTGTATDGSPEAGAAALQVDPSGDAQLYVSVGTDTTDPDIAIGEAQDALDALTWGYCDPDAEVTTNCPAETTSP